MEFSSAILSQTKLTGQQFDYKRCFAASNEHFTCLDRVNDLVDNHQKCELSYKSWRSQCDAGIRRHQMDSREQEKQDQRLYTQESLQKYNSKKNQDAKGTTQFIVHNFAF